MKTLSLLAVSLLLPFTSYAAFDHNLSYGTIHSQDVYALQEFLTVQGDYTGPISGNFYALTLQGVKDFQTKNNISPISGYFGILSRGVANGLLDTPAPIEETGTTTQATIPQTPQTFGTTQPTQTVNTPATQTTPILTDIFEISQNTLRIEANQELDLGTLVLPQGLTVSNTTGPKKSTAWFWVDPQTQTASPSFYYEATLTGATTGTQFPVSIQSMDGQMLTRVITVK